MRLLQTPKESASAWFYDVRLSSFMVAGNAPNQSVLEKEANIALYCHRDILRNLIGKFESVLFKEDSTPVFPWPL